MNKRHQELRDLIRKDKFMPEKVKVLSKSPLYGNSRALYRYKDLLAVIDFTKIADMLHLITHYGAVSVKKIEDAENEKQSKEIRRSNGKKIVH